jgi:hypothetical protein
MLFLSMSHSLVSKFPFFMLDAHEAIDSPVESQNVSPDESDRSQKPLFKTGETRPSGFIEIGGSQGTIGL